MERVLFTQDKFISATILPDTTHLSTPGPDRKTMSLNYYNSDGGLEGRKGTQQKAASPLGAGENKGKEFLKPMSLEEVSH